MRRVEKEAEAVSHEWGNYPENITPKMYWGARAILERESNQPGKVLYLLPDRQSFERLEGSQRDQDAFFDWINTEVLPELRHLARENRFYEWNDLVTIRSEDGSFLCQATPKGSGGEYLYIGCWEIEQEPTMATTTDDDHHTAPSSTGGDYSLADSRDTPGVSVSDFI